MVEGLFTEVAIERWNAPLLKLADRDAVRDYLIGKGLSRGDARVAADQSRRSSPSQRLRANSRAPLGDPQGRRHPGFGG
jgi:hypothetical protein